jgi:seryl-tRNA synthetase
MLSLKYINENIEKVKSSMSSKNIDFNLDDLLNLDMKRKKLINKVEAIKSERNLLNKNISDLRKNNLDSSELINSMKSLSASIKLIDIELNTVLDEINNKLLHIPNTIDDSVPIGGEDQNIIVREWGEKPSFNFDIKGHKELCELNELVDFKRAINMSGTGFPLYTKKGAKLERSLINFMLDLHIDNSYDELFPPFLVTSNSPTTTGNLPKFKDDMYYIENDDLYCIPTAEVPITNIHYHENLLESELPKKYVAYSACFRREAGSYGKDTKGLLRLHQFNKVELVKFVKPENSYSELEKLVNDAEKVLQALNLHYRVITLASGDLSFSAAKCYDIEVWSPFENKYLEVSSCSNFESFQATRGKIKYRKKETNKLEFVHTLNGSGLATPRLFVSLLETYQCRDSSFKIPKVLQSYYKDKKFNV